MRGPNMYSHRVQRTLVDGSELDMWTIKADPYVRKATPQYGSHSSTIVGAVIQSAFGTHDVYYVTNKHPDPQFVMVLLRSANSNEEGLTQLADYICTLHAMEK